jgi:hypothetical protein
LSLLVSLSASVVSAQEPSPPAGNANGATDSSVPVANVRTLAELPLSPPTVVCNGQQLTITANNSTLGSILADVHNCTGAQIDIPDGASSSRIFDHLGPGPARDVLTALLGETGFDFVIGASDQSPEKVASVLLMARAKDPAEAAIADRNLTPARRAYLQMLRNARPRSETPEDNTQEPESTTDASTTEQPPVTPAHSAGTNANPLPASDPSSVAAPGATPLSTPSSTPSSAGATPSSTQSGSTEDQINNMEQLFEQRQKMMQGQNPPHPQ